MDAATINGKQIRRKVQLYTLYKAPQAGITKEEALKINAVREFPAGVGFKKQEEL